MINKPLFGIVCFALSAFLFFFFVLPVFEQRKDLSNQKLVKLAELRNKEEYFANIRAVHIQLQDFEKQLERIDNMLPPKASLPSLYELLQELSNNSGLFLKSIVAQVQGSEGPLKVIDIELTVAGPYEGLKDFLQNTRKSWRFLAVDSLSFEAPKAGKVFEALLKMRSYSY